MSLFLRVCFVYIHFMPVCKNTQFGSLIYKFHVFRVKFAQYVRILGDIIRPRNCLITCKIYVNNLIIYVNECLTGI